MPVYTMQVPAASTPGDPAALDEAEINLGYTEVKAPISGVIGGALVTEGALVNADSGDPLATIQQIDPVYADFTQPAGDLLSIRRDIAVGRLAVPPSGGSVKSSGRRMATRAGSTSTVAELSTVSDVVFIATQQPE